MSNGDPRSASDKAPAVLLRLYQALPQLHRRRFYVVLAVMAAGAIAEVVTLGAVIPFLALVSDPTVAYEYPWLVKPLKLLGWDDLDNLLVPVTVIFALAAIVAGATRVILSWLSARFVYMLGHALASEVYRRILLQPYAYHLVRNSSETVAAIQKVHRVTQSVLFALMQSFIGVAIGLCIVTALILVDPVISLAAFGGFGLIYFVVGRITRMRLNRNSEVVAATQHQRIQAVQEGLGGIRDLLIDGTQSLYHKKFKDLNKAYSGAQVTTAFIGESPRFVIEACAMVLIAFLALFMSMRAGGIQAGLPVLGALALGSQRLLPLMQLVHLARTRIRANWHILREVLDLLELPMKKSVGTSRPDVLPFNDAIELSGVSFRYAPGAAVVLSDIDLVVPKGTRLGIVGRTGSGKSTIMDIMMGLLEPTTGTVSIDGTSLSEEICTSWQARLAHVPQFIFLSDATLAENIAFGVEPDQIDIERVREASRKAQLDAFVSTLPDGYQTRVGERGVRLSGGQRQRVGIARALYKRADVLVFDEATSALDTETEKDVMDAINNLGRELTLIIVAHRLTTVATCDQVIRLEEGRIVASGSYKDVVLEADSQ